MLILALDTALAACSVAVVEGGATRAQLSEPMTRGHQERLAPMVAEAMLMAGVGFERLDRVAVTTGPGSFTGLRVGLAFARALALARGVACVGLNTLEALAGEEAGLVVAAIAAPHGHVYAQAFGAGASEPALLDLAAAQRLVQAAAPTRLVGPGARLLADFAPDAEVVDREVADIATLARLAGRRPVPDAPPAPVYLRSPDALTLVERAARA